MSFLGGVKKIMKPLVDVPRWIGYSHLKATSQSVFSLVKKYFVPEQKQRTESFAAALARLQLTEADLSQRAKQFRRLMWLWVFLFALSMSYSLYLLSVNALRGFFPGIGVAVITLTQVFRYHFWIFQIEQRRLGCTFRDWFSTQFLAKKKK